MPAERRLVEWADEKGKIRSEDEGRAVAPPEARRGGTPAGREIDEAREAAMAEDRRRNSSAEPRMVYKTTLKSEFGLTDAMIGMLGNPDKRVCNRHCKSGPLASLYRVDRVQQFLKDHGEELERSKARGAALAPGGRRRAAERREAALRGKYPRWEDALPDACEAMFNLNRYAKHDSCSRKNRDEIYDLKNSLVRILHQRGHAEAIHIHSVPIGGQACWGCGGGGAPRRIPGGDDDGMDHGCPRCDGTGWYRHPGQKEFVCFRFRVNGRSFTWHQPKALVRFEYTATQDGQSGDWRPGGEKPLGLPRNRLTGAKALVRFVLRGAEAAPS